MREKSTTHQMWDNQPCPSKCTVDGKTYHNKAWKRKYGK